MLERMRAGGDKTPVLLLTALDAVEDRVRGLVIREAAPEDRRGAYAVLTEAGSERFQNALKDHVAFVRKNFLELFSDEELSQMAEFWQRVEKRRTNNT